MHKPPIRINTFGLFSITRDGRQIRLPRTKDKALIAFLTTNCGKVFRREYLADLLWPETSSVKSKHCLNQALYSIRRVIPELVSTDRTSVGCECSNVQTDVDELLTAIKLGRVIDGVQLVKGAFLDDLAAINATPFTEWRERCHAEFFTQFEIALQQTLSALPIEQAYRLSAELQPDVRNLLISFLPADQSSPLPRAGNYSHNGLPHVATRPSQQNNVPFVGREEHVAKLQDSLSLATEGLSQFVIVRSNAGFGKTILVNEFLGTLVRDVRVIRTQCHESEIRCGFGPIAHILKQAIHDDELASLEPIWRSAIAQVLPLEFADAIPLPALSADAAQTRLFEAVLRVLDLVSQRSSLVIFIDDAQWCDSSTRSLLAYLTHRLTHAHILFIAAMRTRSDRSPLTTPWREWMQIPLTELSRNDVRELVSRASAQHDTLLPPSDELADLCGGHPYLVSELVRSRLLLRGPSNRSQWTPHGRGIKDIDSFVDSLFDGLSRSEEDILHSLAVIGRPASIALLSRISQISKAGRVIDRLSSNGILTIVGNQVAFRHDLVREAAYRRIPIASRMELHFHTGRRLSTSAGHSGEVAEHYYKAKKRQLANRFALAAIKQADAEHANDEAIYFTKIAINTSSMGTDRLRLDLAERLGRAHRLREAQKELNRIDLMDSGLSTQDRLCIKLLHLELSLQLAQSDTKSVLQQILHEKQFCCSISSALLHRALRLQLRCAYHIGDEAVMRTSIDELKQFAEEYKEYEGSLDARALAARAHSSVHSSVEAQELCAELMPRLETTHSSELRIRILTVIGLIEYEAGNVQTSEIIHERALREIKKVGAMNLWPLVATHAHMLMVEQGQYVKAKMLGNEIEARAHSIGDHYTLAVLHANTTWMLYESEDYPSAAECAEKVIPAVRSSGWTWIDLALTGMLGLCKLQQGNVAGARQLACEVSGRLLGVRRRMGDTSYAELLIARISALINSRQTAIARLRKIIEEYGDREAVCRLRMRLELALILKHIDKTAARHEARDVFEIARRFNTLPIAERADALLRRL
jgi:hypothetical protein